MDEKHTGNGMREYLSVSRSNLPPFCFFSSGTRRNESGSVAVHEGCSWFAALRGANRLRVIETVQRSGGASRVELVRVTGLSRSTVSSVVAELLAEHALVEKHDRPSALPANSAGTIMLL